MVLRVLEVFDSIQGEGFWTGTPMTFVRLAGCNAPELGLGCVEWCDTQESWGREGGTELAVSDVILQVRLPRLCLTGGEPLLQREGAARLAAEARGLGMRVHLETNGTVEPPLPEPASEERRVFDWVTISPKPPDYKLARGWRGMVDELKLVVDRELTTGTAERLAADYPESVVSIQPAWGSSAHDSRLAGPEVDPAHWAAERAINMVMDHPEWRLSLQTQKFLGIR